MIYQPKIIFNPTNEKREFMYDHNLYIFQPGEKKLLDGAVAYHVLHHVNGPFKEYVPGVDDELVTSSNVAYDKMPWREVVSLASKRGIFKPGMPKDEVLKALVEADEQGA